MLSHLGSLYDSRWALVGSDGTGAPACPGALAELLAHRLVCSASFQMASSCQWPLSRSTWFLNMLPLLFFLSLFLVLLLLFCCCFSNNLIPVLSCCSL